MRTAIYPSRGLRLLPALALLVALAAGLFPNPTSTFAAAIPLASSYSQDFDSLAASGTANAWADDSTLDGWYSSRTVLIAGTGTNTAGGLYSFGATSSAERALGSLGSNTVGSVYYGVRLVNNTSSTIDELSVAYTGEQWRNGGNTAQHKLDVSYQLGATDLTSGTWTAVDSLDFTGPVATSTAGLLDGNLAANRSALSATLTGLGLAPGQEIWLRWEDVNDSGNDHGLAIDNFSLTAGPSDPPPTGPVVTISASDSAAAEAGADAGTFQVSRSGDTAAALSVGYSVGGTASNGSDYTPSLSGTVEIAAGSASAEITITPVDDGADEGDETVILTLTDGAAYDLGTPNSATVTIADDDAAPPVACSTADTPIGAIQGPGSSAALTGTRTVQGVITGDYEGSGAGFRGFFLQNTPENDDDNPLTSDGIFVFVSDNSTDRQVGQIVQVTGTAGDFSGQTQISVSNPATQIEICDGEGSITPTEISLPRSDEERERYEGMLVKLPQALTISEYFNYDRFGEIVLALPLDGRDRPFTPTSYVEPGAPAQAVAAEIALGRITLDDGLNSQNPPTLRHPNGDPFSLSNRFRGGDTVQDVVGVLDYRFSLFRIQPTAPAIYNALNPRPAAPEPVGGSLRAASFNVLNYFLTLDDGVNDICGPLLNQECRGADDAGELQRQEDKLVAALLGIDADVVGLIEMENTPGVEPAAQLVSRLNAAQSDDTYAFIDTGVIGTDAIRVGFIYKSNTVAPVGDFAVLDSSVDPRFIDTKNRPALAQTFVESASGSVFTAVINHFKSKGSDCNDVGDPDLGDGAGNCNITRTQAAQALADWLATDPTGSGDPDVLILGDLNSYDEEDPIDALKAAGYTDLNEAFGGEFAYSYVFDGQYGYLDYALASPSLLAQVTGATEWHINADEPDILNYDTSFKPAAQQALYEPNAFQSSDHDPVIVGLGLVAAPPVAVDDEAAAFYRSSTTIAVLDNDEAGETGELTIVSVGKARRGLVSTDGKTITYRHVGILPIGASVSDSFTYTVRDALGRKAKATVRVEITRLRITGVCPTGDFRITNNGSYDLPYSLRLVRSGQIIDGIATPGVSTLSTGGERGAVLLLVADEAHDLGISIPPALCR